MKKVKEAVEYYWGKRCTDYSQNCATCSAWKEYDKLVKKKRKKKDK